MEVHARHGWRCEQQPWHPPFDTEQIVVFKSFSGINRKKNIRFKRMPFASQEIDILTAVSEIEYN